jgi:hypothetical protein
LAGLASGQIATAMRIVMKIIILPGGKNALRMIMLGPTPYVEHPP